MFLPARNPIFSAAQPFPKVVPRAMKELGLIASVLVACSAASVRSDEVTSTETQFFERRIRPLFIENCYECHGPESSEGGLRLDLREKALSGGDRGSPIVRGNPNRSLLIRAVSYDDEEIAMPPRGKLSPEQIRNLRVWIERGAAWPQDPATKPIGKLESTENDHWAFRPVRRPSMPSSGDRSWYKNPIDRFVLAKLEENRLSPSRAADPRVLVRRAFLDLTGLPPTYEEVEQYAAMASTRAGFRQLLDRLLADPGYGERWGRHWLDVARYGDTKGYVDGGQVQFAFAYTYRDYVVRAFNEDLPFDEFIADQLAADLNDYAPHQAWRLAGMGFLTVGRRFNHNYHDTLDDQIDVISRGLQGLTVSCARCHDHKFDPISTADYYSLYGILANSEEPPHSELPILNTVPNRTDPPNHVEELNQRAAEYARELATLHETIQDEMRSYAGDYLVYLVRSSAAHRDGSQNPLKTDRTILRGPTAYGYGSIRRWKRYVEARTGTDHVFGVWHAMDVVPADAFAQHLVAAVDKPSVNRMLRRRLLQAAPTSMVALAKVYGEVFESIHAKWKTARQEDTNVVALPDPSEEEIRQVLYGPDSPAAITAFESLDCYHLDEHTRMRNLAGKVEELSITTASAAPRAMILRQRADARSPVVFRRGRPDLPGKTVPLQVPVIFSPARDVALPADRTALVRAITSGDNPLTARVFVNRVWHWHFGQPLVTTVSDFGQRSDPPSHPELLDFLATWFMESGWSVKNLHRLIMTSNTYAQSSLPRADGLRTDPQNRLLWRFHARRLEWEAIRDSLLSVAGRLDRNGGGRPSKLAPDAPNSVCRSIYLHVDRQEVSKFAQYFDFPSPDFTSPQRPITVVPQQQLFFLNSPFVLAQAEALARDIVTYGATDLQRFRQLHRLVFGREATMSEAEIQRTIESFAIGEQAADSARSWSGLAHAMLQSNAFIMIE